jgi:hypothetical protein
MNDSNDRKPLNREQAVFLAIACGVLAAVFCGLFWQAALGHPAPWWSGIAAFAVAAAAAATGLLRKAAR